MRESNGPGRSTAHRLKLGYQVQRKDLGLQMWRELRRCLELAGPVPMKERDRLTAVLKEVPRRALALT